MDLYQKYLVYISSGLQDWNTFNFVISFEPFLNVSFFFREKEGPQECRDTPENQEKR